MAEASLNVKVYDMKKTAFSDATGISTGSKPTSSDRFEILNN